ncbi:hypothetical protein NY023_05485 [Pseudomonas sp. NBB]|nr:hypothetical protein [Pseudomonas putida]WOB59916.1 hypothetical protein NY023_05485 [Pseudomonas sp. NBB]
MRDRARDDAVVEQFRRDPLYAAELLTEVLQNGSTAELDILLRQISKAFGCYRASCQDIEHD